MKPLLNFFPEQLAWNCWTNFAAFMEMGVKLSPYSLKKVKSRGSTFINETLNLSVIPSLH